MARAAATSPEYPTGDLTDLEEYVPRRYPDGDNLSLSYQDFMELLGHYAQFPTYYNNYGSVPACKKYAKYAEYATYRLLQSFAQKFGLPLLESACTNMQAAVLATDDMVEFTLDDATLDELRAKVEPYNANIMDNITATKEGYSLTAFRSLTDTKETMVTHPNFVKDYYNAKLNYNIPANPDITWLAPCFCISYVPLAPVFQPVKTWYGKVSELEIDQHLRAGSLVYAECSDHVYYTKNRSARFFTTTTYHDADDTAHFIDEKAFSDGTTFIDYYRNSFDYNNLSTNNNPAITRVPSQYTPAPGESPVDVACWKVKNIILPPDNDGDDHPFYSQYAWYWHGDAYPNSGSSPIKTDSLNGNYLSSNHVMVELVPCDEIIIDVPTPQIGLENISLKLEKDGFPTSTGLDSADFTEDNYYLEFYVEPQSAANTIRTGGDSSAVSWDDTKDKRYSGEWTANERLLYPGGWRVYCRAVYEQDSTLYYSDIATKDIHITEPQLSAPTITIDDLTASYTGPTSITAKPSGTTGDALSNSVGSYTPYLQDQQLIRKTTQTSTDTPQDLSLPEGSLNAATDFDVQDTLTAGYNKIFAYTVLTLPENSVIVSVPDKADRSYYSDVAIEEKTFEQASVSFDTQGGSFNPHGTGYQQENNLILVGSTYGVNDALPTASKDYYTFGGWFTQRSGGVEVTPQTTVTEAGSQTLYAHYTDHTYTITFDANGGTGSMADMADLPYHSSRNLTVNAFTRSDGQGAFEFAGWSITAANDNDTSAVRWADGAAVIGTAFQAGEIHWNAPGAGTVTLYAVWKRKTAAEQASLSFDTQGGSFDTNGTGYQKTGNLIPVGSTYGVGDRLPLASKDYYTFGGWFTQRSGGVEVTPQTTVTEAGSQTLYAHYTDHTYTITFNPNGGTGSMADMADLPYHSSHKLTRNAFTKTDSQGAFVFAGWSTTQAQDNDTSAVRWANGASVIGTAFQAGEIRWDDSGAGTGTVTLYAVWKRKTTDPVTPPSPPPNPPSPPAPPSGQVTQVSWNALSNPVQTVQRVIENVKTGDSRPYWKWGILLVIGILTTLYSVFGILYSHFRQKERKCD